MCTYACMCVHTHTNGPMNKRSSQIPGPERGPADGAALPMHYSGEEAKNVRRGQPGPWRKQAVGLVDSGLRLQVAFQMASTCHSPPACKTPSPNYGLGLQSEESLFLGVGALRCWCADVRVMRSFQKMACPFPSWSRQS